MSQRQRREIIGGVGATLILALAIAAGHAIWEHVR
jgi:hypothetical protein